MSKDLKSVGDNDIKNKINEFVGKTKLKFMYYWRSVHPHIYPVVLLTDNGEIICLTIMDNLGELHILENERGNL